MEFCQNSSQESKWDTIYFQSKWRLSFDAIFAFYTKNWSFEKHRIGIIALLWQPILQKLNLKCCCHFCFLWLPTIWRDFFAEKKQIKNHFKCTFCNVLYCILSCLVYFELITIEFQEVMLLWLIVQTFIFVFGYLELSKSWFDINYAKNIIKLFSVQSLLTQLRHLMQAI